MARYVILYKVMQHKTKRPLCHYHCSYVDELLYWSGRRMLLDEYLQRDLTPNRLPPTWVSRTKFVFQSDDGGLAVMDTANDSVKTLVTNHTLRQLNVKGYQCTINLDYVLFKHNVKKVSVYRVNRKATLCPSLLPSIHPIIHLWPITETLLSHCQWNIYEFFVSKTQMASPSSCHFGCGYYDYSLARTEKNFLNWKWRKTPIEEE